MRTILPAAAAILPFAILLGYLYFEGQRRARERRSPLTSFLLRPPGESLRIEIEKMNDALSEQLFHSLMPLVVIGFGTWLVFDYPLIGGTLIAAALVAFVILSLRLLRTLNRLRDYRLGYLGERAIGEELNQLLAQGWRVFHDVPFNDRPGGKPFNIDHVVIGVGGIFAIETKTRRKPTTGGAAAATVTLSNETLTFPWGPETRPIRNAIDRAAHLESFLRKQINPSLTVQPVLALPGWFVSRKSPSPARVVSGREVASLFRNVRPTIDPQTAHATASLIEQKCRDVE